MFRMTVGVIFGTGWLPVLPADCPQSGGNGVHTAATGGTGSRYQCVDFVDEMDWPVT